MIVNRIIYCVSISLLVIEIHGNAKSRGAGASAKAGRHRREAHLKGDANLTILHPDHPFSE
ncbi:MAG: hypothetical protein KGZ49_04690 [Syntrophaceae bacterium]|nr:hypothetical protein [Syntrophaceae bacterium]